MSVAVVTGSSGLIGSEAALHFGSLGLDVVGIDNDMRQVFFGAGRLDRVESEPPARSASGARYTHQRRRRPRPRRRCSRSSRATGTTIELVIHTAAQPSHDWAAREPFADFDINAVGTLNLLEATRLHAPEATFIFTSTNKVYGDRPNALPLVELETRWEIDADHTYCERDPRGHVDRQLPAQPLRRLEGRRRRARAGVRALLRHADGVLPGRDAHRPATTRPPSCTGSSPTSCAA